MKCQHCGAPLPPIAMFCGECGRSVSAPPPVLAVPEPEPQSAPQPAEHQRAEVQRAEVQPGSVRPSSGGPPCSECGAGVEPNDHYCGECGADLRTDTRVVQPVMREEPEPEPEREPEPEPAPAPPPPPVFPDRAVLSDRPVLPDRPVAAARPTLPTNPAPPPEHRFVLQFSTGESYAVLGTGLAGRNPRPEPGEVVDHVVTIADPGRSVSKTHFEFGHDDGIFWVTDRHSGNGSVIREPGRPPRYCEPGHRYHVARGTRLDIGEQFVIIS